MIGIYKITSPSNKVYIGQSVNIEKRFKTYELLRCKDQTILYRSLLKYGVNKHKFDILCECEISELNDKERYYQDAFSVLGKNGMNCKLTTSSDRIGKHSEETKRKIGEANKGKKHSEESKLKMSEVGKGRVFSNETRLKISKIHKYKIVSFETKLKMSEAKKNISEETRNKMSISKLNMSEESKLKMRESKKKIILNTQTGIFYLGLKEASKSVCVNSDTLCNYLNGRRKNKTSLIYI